MENESASAHRGPTINNVLNWEWGKGNFFVQYTRLNNRLLKPPMEIGKGVSKNRKATLWMFPYQSYKMSRHIFPQKLKTNIYDFEIGWKQLFRKFFFQIGRTIQAKRTNFLLNCLIWLLFGSLILMWEPLRTTAKQKIKTNCSISKYVIYYFLWYIELKVQTFTVNFISSVNAKHNLSKGQKISK